MLNLIIGSTIISILHALIPNHWLPVIAIGRKEQWSAKEVHSVTFLCAVAHGLSTVMIGIMLGYLGQRLDFRAEQFTHFIAPAILIILGIVFIYRHHRHKHFHISGEVKKKRSKAAIVTALTVAMFFSPCLEIEGYFLLAGTHGFNVVMAIAAIYLSVTIVGMLILVNYAYAGALKWNWHALEHNAGIITGLTLIITGVVSFIIN